MVSIIAKNPYIAQLVRKLHREGKGYREIASELEKRDFKISHQTIAKYIRSLGAAAKQAIVNDNLIKQQATQEILNTTKQMQSVNKELWNIIEVLKQKINDPLQGVKAASVIVQALDKITRQIELNNKLLGNIMDVKSVHISYLDYSTHINNYLTKLEKKGVIKVLKPEEIME